MRIRTAAKRPMIFSFRLFDRQIVDRCISKSHQTVVIKFPILIAIGAEPISGIIVPFVGEAHGDAIAGKGPKLFDQPIVQLFRPFTFQKLNDLLSSTWKLRAISPTRIDGVRECDPFRSREFHPSSARRTFWMAVSRVKG